jgi:hypothetical protein
VFLSLSGAEPAKQVKNSLSAKQASQLSGAEPAKQVVRILCLQNRRRSCRALNLRSRWQHKAWGASPRIIVLNFGAEPAKAGDSPYMNFDTQSPVSRAPNFIRFFSWGLRPRLYAYACFAG